ncbi:hypothetical protein EYF80_065158 [Liparis tanakae]|uniref:Uncharacterized protein n=1 Tax=Liparis tanakae TaxID=230148 RepID=A0A4Z2E717_9TELE|nr:hypothetical protein EYF80_065158 [Liparis tanakae]
MIPVPRLSALRSSSPGARSSSPGRRSSSAGSTGSARAAELQPLVPRETLLPGGFLFWLSNCRSVPMDSSSLSRTAASRDARCSFTTHEWPPDGDRGSFLPCGCRSRTIVWM